MHSSACRVFVRYVGIVAILYGLDCRQLANGQSLSAQPESIQTSSCSDFVWQHPQSRHGSSNAPTSSCDAGSVAASVFGGNATDILAALTFDQPTAQFGKEEEQAAQGTANQSISPPLDADATASVSGTVRDTLGAPVPAARVTLLSQDNASDRMITADASGAFAFSGLRPGTYRIKVDAAGGLEPFTSSDIVLTASEKREIPVAVVRMAVKNTTVNVVASLPEIAAAQIKQQEEQRILGVLPNFYTSYIWDALPMTPRSKFGLAVRSLIDPATFLVVGGVAAAEQVHDTFPGYGQGFDGYAKRYGATYADTVSDRILSSAVFASLFHQDPRYFYQGSGTVRSRLWHALLFTVACKGDNGRLQPDYSDILGSFASAGLSNVYRAPSDRQVGLTFRNGLIITASGAVTNIMREFLFRKLTPSVPAFAKGKP